MREIKFRGKHDGKWIYGDLIKSDPHTDYKGYKWEYGIHHRGSIYDNTAHLNWNLDVEYVKTETIGEYTGLKDKNGVEIYEGDIVREHETGRIVSIVYNAPEFNFHVNNFGYVFLNHPENFEVIGNIHDNLELLDE